MTLQLTKENMQLFFPSWEKPLSNQEISDFLTSEPLVNEDYERIEYGKRWKQNIINEGATKQYKTQREIRQIIKGINEKLNWWMIYKRTAPNEITKTYCDLHLEEYQLQKEKLQKKLGWMKHLRKSANVTGNENSRITNQDIMRAKDVPLENFIEINKSGFAHCPFHIDKHPSMKIYKNQNRFHCFSCAVNGDVIDLIIKQENCDFIQAVKKLLKK